MLTVTTPTDPTPRYALQPAPVFHTRTYTKFSLCCLDQTQHEKTCGYWYVVKAAVATSHTAFATRAGLLAWLNHLGLGLTEALPDHGCYGVQPLTGTYRTASHLSYDAFYSLVGEPIRNQRNSLRNYCGRH